MFPTDKFLRTVKSEIKKLYNFDISEDTVLEIVQAQGLTINQGFNEHKAIWIPNLGTFSIKEGRVKILEKTNKLKDEGYTTEEIKEILLKETLELRKQLKQDKLNTQPRGKAIDTYTEKFKAVTEPIVKPNKIIQIKIDLTRK